MGAKLGTVLEVFFDAEGISIGKFTRVRVLLNIHNPLTRWTSLIIGGGTLRILLCYEKLADFCYLCGRLDHVQKACYFTIPNELRHYGPWLRASGNNPVSFEDAARDFNRMNAHMLQAPNANSPHTPPATGNQLSSPSLVAPVLNKTISKSLPAIPFKGIRGSPVTPIGGSVNHPIVVDAINSPPQALKNQMRLAFCNPFLWISFPVKVKRN